MKRFLNVLALVLIVSVSGFMTPAAMAAPLYSVAKTTTKTVAKTTVNMRSGASTKYKVLTKVKKNATVSKTGKKKGVWVQGKANGKTGWIHSKYLTTKKTTKYVPAKPRKATSSEQKAWTKSLPSACRKVPITQFIHTNKTKKTGTNFKASVKYDKKGKMYYTLSIDGALSPSSAPAKALMKHECGHVLMGIYSEKKGTKNFQSVLNKGWKSTHKNRVENAADCIADQLGAVRQTKNYKVGYGTKCTNSQKSVAKTITNYSKNR